jgi:adenylate cyclase
MNKKNKPTVRIFGSGEVFEAGLLTSLLNVLLSNRFPIDTICGGRAQCGRCLIRVRSGGGLLSPRRDAEVRKLASLGAADDMRLACQCFTRGEVEIEVINRRSGGSSEQMGCFQAQEENNDNGGIDSMRSPRRDRTDL